MTTDDRTITTEPAQARQHLWRLIKIVQLFHIAKAVVTGQPPKALGEHAEIRLN